MYKLFAVILFAGIVLLSYFFLKDPKPTQIKDVFKEKQVDNGYFQLTPLEDTVLAQSGKMTLYKKDFANDKVLLALELEKNELMIMQACQQILEKGEFGSEIVFYTKKPMRPLKDILNQRGVLGIDTEKVSFQPASGDLFAQAGQIKISRQEIDRSSFHWGALNTKVFYRNLKLIREKIERDALTKVALAANMKTPEYIEKKIIRGGIEVSLVNKEKLVRSYLRKNILDLPIKVNLMAPQFKVELKPDWTPSIGPLEAKHRVHLFSGFYSQSSQDIINQIEELAQAYPHVYFGFHPVFPAQNQYQNMLAEIGFCVWVASPDKYWPFIKGALKASPKTFEKEVYARVETVGLELSPIKDCFYNQQHKKVVSYHLDYAKFLGIHSGPVVLVDGRVFVGGAPIEIIKTTLSDL